MTHTTSTSLRRRALTTAAAVTLAGAGLAVPTTAAFAAGAIGPVTPTNPAAGSAFTVKLTGLSDASQYRLDLTGASTTDTTNLAEQNSCATAAYPTKGTTELTCTITEATPGTYDLKLYEEGARVENLGLTIGKTATPTAPVATDMVGTASDAVTVAYDPSIVWKVNGTPVTWSQGDKTPVSTKQDVKMSGDVTVTAEPAPGYSLPAGATSQWSFRLTDGDPKASTLSSPAAPTISDVTGVDKDTVTFTKVADVTWTYSIDGGKTWDTVTFAGTETSKTLSVPTTSAQGYKVLVRATAAAGKSFQDHAVTKDYTLQMSNSAAAITEKRIAGAGRIDTAIEVSKAYFDRTTDTVYVANALKYPDALAAGPAAARDKAPLLLTMPDSLPDSVAAEIRRLSPTTIKVVGGASVVSTGVESALKGLGATVVRYEGANRYGTAADVAGQWTAKGGTVYLAWGGRGPLDFADALSGGSGAAKEGAPLLLSEKTTLMGPTVEALGRLNPTKVVLIGGTDILSSDLVTQVKQAAPAAAVERYAGVDRYGTSAVVIDKVTGKKAVADNPTTPANEAVTGSTIAFLATGLNFPDALAGVPAANKVNAPLALTQPRCLPLSVKTQLDRLSLAEVVRLGGRDVLADFGNVACS